MIQVTVIGSRCFVDWEGLCRVLDAILEERGPFLLLSGGARGADNLAEAWAILRGMPYLVYKADWGQGKGAGFARNTLLAQDADLVVAFWDWDSAGTKDTLAKAQKLGKPIIAVPCNPEGFCVSAPQHWAITYRV